MSSNDDSPVSQPHSVEPSLPSSSNKNPQIDTVADLLRIIFRMDWRDWTLTAILISCLINHYFLTILSVAQPIIDFTRLITALISVIFIAYKAISAYKTKELITTFFKNHPLQLFVSIIACGATTAFFLPLILNIFKFIGDTDKLTTALLASTGGVIAVFTLIKTHQKNQNDEISLQLDREKYEKQKEDRLKDIEMQNSQIKEQKRQFNKKTKQEAYSSHQERIRQIHAERRSRYAKAIEQLANDKLAVRLGGIYTLTGLADEWISDSSLDKESQHKEGQFIINNLCAYIRSPFPLSLHRNLFESKSINDEKIQIYNKNCTKDNFAEDRIKFLEEQEARRVIFTEMSKRFTKIDKNGLKHLGPWSSFDFNLTKSKIFYPLNNLTFENCNFTAAIFYGDADFTYSGFAEKVLFTAAHFMENATFRGAYFSGDADFIGARFEEAASFYGTRFTKKSKFNSTIFMGPTDFREAEFRTESPTFGLSMGKLSNHALFSCNVNQKYYDFSISDNSPRPIIIGNAQLGKKKFEIPIESKVFDPESWDNTNQEYSRTSNPAKLSKKSTCTIKRIFKKIKT